MNVALQEHALLVPSRLLSCGMGDEWEKSRALLVKQHTVRGMAAAHGTSVVYGTMVVRCSQDGQSLDNCVWIAHSD